MSTVEAKILFSFMVRKGWLLRQCCDLLVQDGPEPVLWKVTKDGVALQTAQDKIHASVLRLRSTFFPTYIMDRDPFMMEMPMQWLKELLSWMVDGDLMSFFYEKNGQNITVLGSRTGRQMVVSDGHLVEASGSERYFNSMDECQMCMDLEASLFYRTMFKWQCGLVTLRVAYFETRFLMLFGDEKALNGVRLNTGWTEDSYNKVKFKNFGPDSTMCTHIPKLVKKLMLDSFTLGTTTYTFSEAAYKFKQVHFAIPDVGDVCYVFDDTLGHSISNSIGSLKIE